jgi:hypothetical protein
LVLSPPGLLSPLNPAERKALASLLLPSPKNRRKNNLAQAVRRAIIAADGNHREIDRLSQIGLWGTLLISAFSFTQIHPFPRSPLFPASGPATSSFNGLHPKSNFLAINNQKQFPSNLLDVPESWDERHYPAAERVTDAVERIMGERPARSAAARARAERLFDHTAWVARHGEIFAQLLGEGGRR